MTTSSGQHIAYQRVSSTDQNLDRQLEGVNVEFSRIFADKTSGKTTDRPALQEMLSYVREGDTVHVHSIDRMARNIDDLRRMVTDLNAKGVKLVFHKENLAFTGDKTDPMANLMLTMLGAFAQFERELIHERQREGIALAKERGVYKGRQSRFSAADVAAIKERIANGESKAAVAESLGVSRMTVYSLLKR